MTTIANTLCLHCSEPIGSEEYAEVLTLARFGQTMYVHKRCDDDGKGEVREL